jgi:outer membrane lipoprotein
MLVRLLTLILVLSLCACSTKPVIPVADRSLSPKEVAQGAIPPATDLQWGGVIIATRNLSQASEVEILAYPLDDQGLPTTSAASMGRFIARLDDYLEAADYTAGRLVTATGQFLEVRMGQVGEAEYRFPILNCDDLALWPKERKSRAKPSFHFGFGASSGGRSYGGIGIGIGF